MQARSRGEVETEAGRVRGARDGRVWGWRGVPYAAPPTGPLRFRPPAPPVPWTGVRDASRFGPAAPQHTLRFGPAHLRQQSEDCLHLNIWSPAADARPRPVLVWVHGGGFVAGSGTLYRGEPLAAGGDIVVVTLDYRLGAFGFVDFAAALDDPEVGRNLGLRDIAAALTWVRRNIAGFGGDPDRVTLAGQSAGACATALLMRSAATSLFDQAILQGGSFNLAHAATTARAVAATHLDHLHPRPRRLADLQGLPAAQLLAAQRAVVQASQGVWPAAPVFDGALLPASFAAAVAAEVPPLPLLAGATRDGVALFGAMPGPPIPRIGRSTILDRVRRDLPPDTAAAISRLYPDTRAGARALAWDATTVMPVLHEAERHAAKGAPTWLYRFDHGHPWRGAYPGLDLLFLWPFPGLGSALRRGGFLTGLRSGLSERMRAAWTNFVRTGSPGEDWPAFAAPDRLTRLFALQDNVVADPMRTRRQAWTGRDVEMGR